MLNTSNGSKESMQFQQDLLKFPPELRKLAVFIAQSDEFLSISEYAKRAGFSPSAVRVATFRAKKKGNDFNKLLGTLCNEKLIAYKPQMMKVLVAEGLKGDCKAVELFFKLTGDLHHEKTDTNPNIQSLTFVLAMPDTLHLSLKEKSVREAEPIKISTESTD